MENNSESGGIMQIREIGGMDRGRNFLRPDPLKKNVFFVLFFLGGGGMENNSESGGIMQIREIGGSGVLDANIHAARSAPKK